MKLLRSVNWAILGQACLKLAGACHEGLVRRKLGTQVLHLCINMPESQVTARINNSPLNYTNHFRFCFSAQECSSGSRPATSSRAS